MTEAGPQREPAATPAREALPPPVGRLLARHPGLAGPVAAVLAAGEALRRARAAALPGRGLPAPAAGPPLAAAADELERAVEALEGLALRQAGAGPEPSPAEVAAAADRLLAALVRLRVESHVLTPGRRSSSPEARATLFRALRAFDSAFADLERQAARRHVGRLPWQLELACLVDPGRPVEEMEITGYELPGLPVTRRPWGERCWLTGTPFHTDSHRRPAPRYRSLESCHALAPRAHGLVARAGEALTALARNAPEPAGRVRRALPFLFADYVADRHHPTFARLGLLDFPSLAVTLNNLLTVYADRPFLGTPGPAEGFAWETFAEVRRVALRLARALAALGLEPGDRLGILPRQNGREFYLADFACVFAGLVSVGLPPGLEPERAARLLERQSIRAVVADGAAWRRLATSGLAARCPGLETAIVFADGAAPAAGGPPRRFELAALLAGEAGRDGEPTASGIRQATGVLFDDPPGRRRAAAAGIEPDGDDDLYTVLFTSGSTGEPQATPFSRHRWRDETRSEATVWPYVGVSFQPSSAAADRASVWRALHNGGRVGFVAPGPSFFARVRELRPTVFDGPPAIWNTIYADYRRAIGDGGLSAREAATIRRRFRHHLGGRLAFIATGGAPGCDGVNRAMEQIFGVPMNEGYGTTETGQIAVDGELVAGLDYRLVDRPEYGCRLDDRPHPRGELAIRAPAGSSGWADPERLTADGYFLTGDLVAIGPGRRVLILGRCREVLKLASAEAVSPERLERIYQESEAVEAVIVTGLPSRNDLVAVVVPTVAGTTERELLDELRAIAGRRGLPPRQVPVGVVVAPRPEDGLPWTPDNGLLTPTFKPDRRAIQERYAAAIDAAYRRADGGGEPEETGGRRPRSAGRRLRRLAASLLARRPDEIDMERSFLDNGADSLRTMELALRIDDLFGGKSGAHGLSGAALTELAEAPLAELAAHLAAAAAVPPPLPAVPASGSPAAGSAEPAAAGAAPAEGTAPEAVARRANADAAAAPEIDATSPPAAGGDVLVTGANGFLGIHLTAELAAELAPGERLLAMVRAEDDEAARRRLAAAFAAAGLEAPPIGRPGDRRAPLVALAGSLERPRLGLDEKRWDGICDEVGAVYHLAAAVTGSRGYADLRRPNVGGTRRLLELATRRTLKAFHFVSSLNVTLLAEQLLGRRVDEETALPEAISPAVAAAHAAYALSKWVGERLVGRVLARRPGWRVSVSRPALLGWSSRTGFGNRDDVLDKVLRSCLALRAVPAGEEAAVPNWIAETESSLRGVDLVPVDFAAAAVARLGRLTRDGALPPPSRAASAAAPTFHVSNLAPGEHGLVTLPRLFDLLVAADLGRGADRGRRALCYTPTTDWLSRVEIEAAPALAVLAQLGAFDPTIARPRAERFAAAMDGALNCPPVDERLLAAFVRRHEKAA